MDAAVEHLGRAGNFRLIECYRLLEDENDWADEPFDSFKPDDLREA